MTLTEAVQVFDRVEPPEPGQMTLDGEAVGVPYCCGLPVVMRSADGVARIGCLKCGRTIQRTGREWAISHWGTRVTLTPTPQLSPRSVFRDFALGIYRLS
jgi:hypothetical protein